MRATDPPGIRRFPPILFFPECFTLTLLRVPCRPWRGGKNEGACSNRVLDLLLFTYPYSSHSYPPCAKFLTTLHHSCYRRDRRYCSYLGRDPRLSCSYRHLSSASISCRPADICVGAENTFAKQRTVSNTCL